MAKTKWQEVQAQLAVIQFWTRAGMSEEEIAKKLGINVNTLYAQKRKYPELAKVLEKPKVKCKCPSCDFPHRERHDGLSYLVCGQEACFVNCNTCDTPPNCSKKVQNRSTCDDCGAKVVMGEADFFLERGTFGIPKGQRSKMVCRQCYETKYSGKEQIL